MMENKMMKVAFVVPSLANKGPVIVARDLVNAMVQKSEVTCVVYYFDQILELKFDCETVHIVSPDQMNFEGFDIVHTHMLRPDIHTALRRKKFHRAKIVSTIHSYMDKDLKNSYGPFVAFFARRIWCYFLNKFDKVVCLSGDMKNYYSKFIRQDKLTFIYNGRFPAEKKQDVIIPEEDSIAINLLKTSFRIIGGIGNLTKIKGFEQLIKMLAINPAYALVIIGEGPEKANLQKIAEDLKVSDRCLFLGYRAEAREYFAFFDLYGMTSLSEGFPLVLLEAASFGIPAICSDIPIFKEIFTDKEVSFFNLWDIADLSRQLDVLWENREMFSINIRKKFEAGYTADAMADNYIKLYKQLLTEVPSVK